jgi:spermidine/putrescine transport system permease protein
MLVEAGIREQRSFPLWVFGAVKVGIPPQVFVLGTTIFMVGVVIAIGSILSSRRSGRWKVSGPVTR